MVAPAEPVLKTKMEDMGSLRGPRKPKAPEQLRPVEIIKQSAAKEAPNMNPDQVLSTLNALVQRGAVKLLQIGNTVFSIIPKGGNTAEFHTFTVEAPEKLVDRFKAGANSLKQMGFKQAVTYSESPAFVKMAKQTGLPVKVTHGEQTVQGKKKPVYQFVLDL
jgi:hypothetical protein